MLIVADENIPHVQRAFAPFGTVRTFQGRSITPEIVREADVLLVRSITRVNRELLDGSAVRFVGTATIGTDHIDQEYLREKGIFFTDAAGCNAESVVQYVLTALLVLAERHQWDLAGKTLGIVGVGHIGSIIERKCRALGLVPLPNDPPLQRQTGDTRYVSLDEALQADFITLHVPLTKTGSDPTWHLLDADKLDRLKSHQVLINSSRGAVVDNAALRAVLQKSALGSTVLDVWENEPNIDVELLNRVTIGTPHIAGYSLEGKIRGTILLYEALCQYLNQPTNLAEKDLLPQAPGPSLELNSTDTSTQALLTRAMTTGYPLLRDDTALRQWEHAETGTMGTWFDHLRKTYPVRREPPHTHVRFSPPDADMAKKLQLLGFQVTTD